MVQSAESLLRKDSTRSCGTNPAIRCPFLKSEMRAILMMVTNILREQSLQMAFTQRNNVVQQVSSAAFDPTLRYTVLPGTPERGLHRAHFQGSNCRWKLPTIFRISIEDQKLGSGTKWKRFPQLGRLLSPVRGRERSVKHLPGPSCHSPRVAVSVCIPGSSVL
jgi:hypothetical protein